MQGYQQLKVRAGTPPPSRGPISWWVGPTAIAAPCTPSFSPVARVGAKVPAPIEVPDERDLPQHHTAGRHGEVGRRPQQVRAAQGPREVPVLHDDGAWMQLCHHRLPISGLWGGGRVNLHARMPFPRPGQPLPASSPSSHSPIFDKR